MSAPPRTGRLDTNQWLAFKFPHRSLLVQDRGMAFTYHYALMEHVEDRAGYVDKVFADRSGTGHWERTVDDLIAFIEQHGLTDRPPPGARFVPWDELRKYGYNKIRGVD
jgi:hypothetical protein